MVNLFAVESVMPRPVPVYSKDFSQYLLSKRMKWWDWNSDLSGAVLPAVGWARQGRGQQVLPQRGWVCCGIARKET